MQKFIKVNNLAYIEPRWYGDRIYANCQQKLLFTKQNTSGRFLEVTFLEKQKREDGMESELNFEDNFTCFSWLVDFISSTVIQDELRRNLIISVKEKASPVTIPTQIKTVREDRMLQVLLLLLSLLLSLSIQIFNRKFNNQSRAIYYLGTKIHRILQENQCGQQGEEKKTGRKAGKLHLLQMKIKMFIHATGYFSSQHWLTANLPYLIYKGS